MVTALARLGGRSVGIVANNPAAHDGVLCASACKKGGAFHPPVRLLQHPGRDPGQHPPARTPWTRRRTPRPFPPPRSSSSPTPRPSCPRFPSCADRLGRRVFRDGLKAVGADAVYAWPKAYIAPINAEAAVRILEKEEIRAASRWRSWPSSMRKNNGALAAAEEGLCDDVIEPAATRQMIAAALEMLMGKREVALPRKHGNLPL